MTRKRSERRSLAGDWRARVTRSGVARIAHVWGRHATSRSLPGCGRRILRAHTARVAQPMDIERCCTDCLVAGIGGRVDGVG